MKKDFAIFHIAFKILLRKGNKVLFLRIANKDYFNFLDLPGGRADKGEEKTPVRKILDREVREEIGKEVKYKVGNVALQYHGHSKPEKIYDLITVYEARYISGKIKLSSEHLTYEWINPKAYKFKEKEFFCRKVYLAFKEYLKFK